MLVQSATNIITVLQTPPPSLIPKLHYGDNVRNAINQLARLLKGAVQRTKPTYHKIPSLRPVSSPAASLPRVQLVLLLRVQNSPVPCCVNPPPAPVAAAAAQVSQLLTPNPIAFALPDPPHYKHHACNHFLAQHVFTTPVVNHIYNEQMGKQETIDMLLAGSNAHTWRRALSNEIGRLAKGVIGCIAATETIEFIKKHEVPCHKKVIYANMVCDYRPLKTEQMRVCLTVGRDRLPYANPLRPFSKPN